LGQLAQNKIPETHLRPLPVIPEDERRCAQRRVRLQKLTRPRPERSERNLHRKS
jgi:hypothetical protein